MKMFTAGSRRTFTRALAKAASESPQVQISTLKNGLKVVTDSTAGHFSALGAYIDAGSRYETTATSGISHMIDRMAWKSTPQRSGQQMMEDLAKLGGNYMCGTQRELILYQASVFNKDVGKMFGCIAETIQKPQFSEIEVNEAQLTTQYELEELIHKSDMYLPEILHAVAYGDKTLGMPLYGTEQSVNQVTREQIVDFHQQFYQPQNTTLAFVGVDHGVAVEMAETHLGSWQSNCSSVKANREKSQYVGGEICIPYQEPRYSNLPQLIHMQIGFETEGLLSEDLYALATLQKLLGGGLSFSAGGPGKGMFSRLFRVLNQYPFVENCMAFNHAHQDSGLFGITISCYKEHAQYMAQVVAHEFLKIMEVDVGKGGISKSEFKRAQNQLIASLLMNVESKLAALEDIGRQVQCQGKVTTVDEMVRKIEALDIETVRGVAQKVFLGRGGKSEEGKPSVVMQGERESFGDVEYVLRYFGLGKWDTAMPDGPRDYSKKGFGRFFN